MNQILLDGFREGLLGPGMREALAALGGCFLGAGIALLLVRRENRDNKEAARAIPQARRKVETAREEILSELKQIEGTLRDRPARAGARQEDPSPLGMPRLLRIDPIRMETPGDEEDERRAA